MSTSTNSLELVNHKMASAVCAMDAQELSSNPDDFIKDNQEVWYLFINTWLLIIDSYSKRTRILVQDGIIRHGLLKLIREGDTISERLMHSHSDGSEAVDLGSFFRYLFADLAESVDAERKVLTILRFGKRLSPVGADKVTQKGLEAFEALNTRNRQRYIVPDCPACAQNPLITADDRIEVHTTTRERSCVDYDLTHKSSFWPAIKQEFRRLVGFLLDNDLNKEFLELARGNAMNMDSDIFNSECMLSNGSTYEHARVLSEKMHCLSAHFNSLESGTMMYTLQGYTANTVHYKQKRQRDWVFVRQAQLYKGKMTHFIPRMTKGEHMETYRILRHVPKTQLKYWLFEELPNACRVVAVPKSYKTPRIIAMEQTWRGYILQGLRQVIVDGIAESPAIKYLNVEDQTPNQEWAWAGSIDRNICTIDLTGASDSIDDVMGYDLLPEWNAFWDEIRSKYLDMPDGRRILSHIFLTSGTPITFVFESVLFLSIANVVTDYVQVFEERQLSRPRTFGDDLEIDIACYDTLIDVMSSLGFIVNVSKSFGPDTNYRESCGVEYLNGYPLHAVKWPRTCLDLTATDGSAESVASLASLQRKIYDLSWDAQYFLSRYLRDRFHLTSSSPYTDVDDLWSSDPEFGVRIAPHKGELPTSTESDPWYREAHKSLVSKGQTPQSLSPDTEMWNYTHFLKYGPQYEDELSRLLHVSTSVRRAEQYALPSNSWRTVTR